MKIIKDERGRICVVIGGTEYTLTDTDVFSLINELFLATGLGYSYAELLELNEKYIEAKIRIENMEKQIYGLIRDRENDDFFKYGNALTCDDCGSDIIEDCCFCGAPNCCPNC